MQIDRRITNGLAWAGVLLVIGVPTADMLSAQFMGDSATAPVAPAAQVAVVQRVAPVPAPLSQRPAAPVVDVAAAKPVVTAPTPVAAATPAKPAVVAPSTSAQPATQTASVVDDWVNSGKPLPSYITGAPSTPPAQVAVTTPPVRTPIITTTPAAPVAPAAAIDPVQVASIAQPKIAPMPMPLSMRPTIVSTPVATVRPSTDLIVAPSGNAPRPPANVTADDLADWESGPLSEFLARRQAQGGQQQADVDFDDDGFFLDEGPNGQPRQRDRLIGPADDFFFPFGN